MSKHNTHGTLWSADEESQLLSALQHGACIADIKIKGRSAEAIKVKAYRLKHKPETKTPTTAAVVPSKAAVQTTYETDKEASHEKYWERKYKTLEGKYNKAVSDNTVVERLVKEIKDIAPLSYSPAPTFAHQKSVNDSEAQSLVVLLSDTHIGKVTEYKQTLGVSQYNFDIFLDRLAALETRIINIAENHINTEIDELVVFMLGDMLDGALNHGAEIGQRNTLISQYYNGSHALAQFVRNLAAYFPKVRVETVVGNHTRFQNQRKTPSDNRNSNFDMFLYTHIEALTSDVKNVKWNLTMQPFVLTEIKGKSFMATHGDHMFGGDTAFGLPLHALGRQISSMTQLMYKNGKKAPEYYVSGHIHRPVQLPHGLGEVIINGGFPGLDNYALQGGFAPVDPVQKMFTIHPVYGKAACFDIYLKFAREGEGRARYTIPSNFNIE